MSPSVSFWLNLLPLAIPLVQKSVEAIAGLIAGIRATPGLSAEQQDALISVLKSNLAQAVADVKAVPVYREPSAP